jgi:hypothetical protein
MKDFVLEASVNGSEARMYIFKGLSCLLHGNFFLRLLFDP